MNISVLGMCIACTLAHIPSLLLRYLPFKEMITVRQKRVLFSIYAVVLTINGILYGVLAVYGRVTIKFYKYDLLLVCILTAIVNALVIRHRSQQHLFAFGLSAIIVVSLFTTVTYIESFFMPKKVGMQISINALILCLLFTALYPLEKKIAVGTITPFLDQSYKKYWENICLIPVVMFFASVLSFPMGDYVKTLLDLMTRLLIGLATLFICRSIAYDYQILEKRAALQNALEEQKVYYAALSAKITEIRKARHDFRHHLSVISTYAQREEIDKIKTYCSQLIHTEDNAPSVFYTGNNVADAVFYHYVCLCKAEGIQLEIKGTLKDVPVADTDLSVLLGNLLENAYTACRAYKGEKNIHVLIERTTGLVTIIVANSFDGIVLKEKGQILSRKRKDQPGIGLKSIAEICHKYDGDMRIKYDEKTFSVMLLLNN